MPEKFYITTPIYYVNDKPHLGHSYTEIAADVVARYRRLKGEEVFFLTGTDEHGAKIEESAQKKGVSPQQLCDENSKSFKDAWKSLNISYDNFVRTTDKNHIKAIQSALQVLYDKGFIYKGEYKGLYCVGCEQYKTESELVAGKCLEHQVKPEVMKEESYLFKLSAFENILKKKIKKGELVIEPKERKNEMLSFLKGGLKDISISREKVKWGIPLPFDEKFTAYVWVDALLNYLTGIGWKGDPKFIPGFWPADLQLLGKDIIRIHSTIWPALLLALDIPLPQRIFANGYFTIEGKKMSKSLGNVIWPKELVEKFGTDGARYLALSAFPFGNDGDISWNKLIQKYNSDLANNIGNLVNRVLTMAENAKLEKSFSKEDDLYKIVEASFDKLNLKEILDKALTIASKTNQEIDKEKPWERDSSELGRLFYIWLERTRLIGCLLLPFLPDTSLRIFEKLGLEEQKRDFKEAFEWGGLPENTTLKKGEPLFLRVKS